MINSIVEKIELILDQAVRPQLAEHHGNVRIVKYDRGILQIRLTGQCSGCPSALLTTEEIIAETIKSNLPEITDVRLVTGVSDELIAQARAILHNV